MRAALRVLLTTLLISPCLAEQPRGRLLVFGDDLGDTGNLRKLTNNSNIGYSDGRLTNGPVFVEYMAAMLNKQLSSFAYAQSAIDDTWLSPEADGHQVPSLDDQIVKFADAERDWIRRKSEPRNSLVVISAGASDVLRQKEPLSALNMELSQKLVKGVFRQIDRVQKLGFDSIVVANLPALYALPRWQVSASVDTLRSFVRTTNTLFRERLVDRGRGGGSASLRLWLLDVEDFQLVTANATFARSIGARNTTGACITAAGSCKDPADFVFYDDVHMDMRLHHLLGLAAATMVQGGDVQYNATYFGQLAKEYDIGVLYHTTATMFDDSSTGPDGMAATAAAAATDPLLTVTSSSVANCSLTVMCTSVTQSSVVLEQRLQSNSQEIGFGLGGIWWQQAYICIACLLVVFM